MCSLVAGQGFEMFLGFGCCFGVLPLMGTGKKWGESISSLCQYITKCESKKHYFSSMTAERSSISKRTCNVAIVIAGFEGTCL